MKPSESLRVGGPRGQASVALPLPWNSQVSLGRLIYLELDLLWKLEEGRLLG